MAKRPFPQTVLINLLKPKHHMSNLQLFSLSLLFFIISCTTEPKIIYPDNARPGLVPQLFSPSAISLPGRLEQNITATADGKEWYYGITDSKEWWYRSILRMQVVEDGSTKTDTPAFVRNFHAGKSSVFIGEPVLSADGSELYFVAGWKPDIWVSKRKHGQEWQTPVLLDSPINTSKASEWHPMFSEKGTMYFASTRTDSHRIYKSERVNGTYKSAVMLKGGINAHEAGDPCIAADESFIVFSSARPGGLGGNDLYVSYPLDDGSWSDPVHLSNSINTDEEELGPRISPDGKYLFFFRRDKWQNATASDIYWVDIEVVKRHLKNRKEKVAAHRN
jgi:hypothetical protein